jgi:Subtilase family
LAAAAARGVLANMEAVMTVNYSKSRILAKASEFRPGDIDRLNKILDDAGLGRPLRHPEASAAAAGGSGLIVLPLAGADPMAVRDTVRAAAGKGGGEMPGLIPDYQYGAGTVQAGARDAKLFSASGKKSGHGLVAWLPAPAYEMPPSQQWQNHPRPPVIALLDSGVQQHHWLPGKGGPPFVINAEAYGWPAPMLPDPEKQAGQDPDYGTHWGHATFLAGLIRLAAPDAQVLSMRVMNSAGKVCEADIAQALTWLADHAKTVAVDVVLMAFGRQADPDDPDLENIGAPIQRLTDLGVRIVASAGNNGSEQPVYPAAFAAKPGQSVASVGALATPTERAPYSNFGPWVHRWGKGTNVLSIMPLTTKGTGEESTAELAGAGPAPHPGDGYAWWSGTSFAAATCAGKLAARPHSGEALPELAAEA